MAELLGAVASGFRIKTLLEDVRDVPEDLERHLGQIQILAPLLAEIDHGPSISNGALLAAAQQCRQAALELDGLATDLSRQLQCSRGIHRRIRSLQVVLQKSTLARHEKRVQATMEMLMLALQLTSLCRQNELIQLQYAQPGIIAAEVVGSLGESRGGHHPAQPDNHPGRESGVVRTKHPVPSPVNRALRQRLGYFHPTKTVGLGWLTGSIEVQTTDWNTTNHGKDSVFEDTWCRIRVRLPRWLSERALDSILYKDSLSWNHVLIPYNERRMDSIIGSKLHRIMRNDDVQEIERLFRNREITANDYFTCFNCGGVNHSLFSLAIRHEAWKIGNYLEERGVSPEFGSVSTRNWNASDVDVYYRQQLMQRLNGVVFDSWFLINIYLSSFDGTIQEFESLRRSLWPDSEFFQTCFAEIRVYLATSIASSYVSGSIKASLRGERIRHILFHTCDYWYDDVPNPSLCFRVLEVVELNIGSATTRGNPSDQQIWTELWAELAVGRQDGKVALDKSSQLYGAMRRKRRSSWLSSLVEGVWLGSGTSRKDFGRLNMAINEAIRLFLQMLKTCRVNLVSAVEIEISMWEVCGSSKRWRNRSFPGLDGMEFCCIGITYGPNPEDFRFWSADNTESYAGDFWELVDPTPLWMPGGWVGDDMDRMIY
ncbi:hypothetical protein PG997_008729 [Apiospora hydei]|uniref:Uncharacterized protein n=1 Tax=Apiospora hydei TaxID=1337664 RepID=A0ABR1WBM2_9PEZI